MVALLTYHKGEKLSQKMNMVMVSGGHDLVLSVGLSDGNARTRGLKRGCPKKDEKINNKNLG